DVPVGVQHVVATQGALGVVMVDPAVQGQLVSQPAPQAQGLQGASGAGHGVIATLVVALEPQLTIQAVYGHLHSSNSGRRQGGGCPGVRLGPATQLPERLHVAVLSDLVPVMAQLMQDSPGMAGLIARPTISQLNGPVVVVLAEEFALRIIGEPRDSL